MTTSIKHPESRAEVIYFLRDFANPEHGRRVCVEGHVQPDLIDTYEHAVAELFNSMGVYPNPADAIGWALTSNIEAAALKQFFDELENFWAQQPEAKLTNEMISSEQWQNVQAAAQGFLASLTPCA